MTVTLQDRRVVQMTGKFVAYIRVSTQKQGKSGLGLEAQREAITNYLNGGKWSLAGEFVEVESGKRNDRPELAKALALCRLHKATLLVAKLDRLARNVAFVSALMESKVKFVAVDLPEANNLTVHIMAAMAEYEADAIRERTRLALAAAKARGTALGGRRVSADRWARIASKGRKAGTLKRSEESSKWAQDVLPVIEDIRQSGAVSLRQIAEALNARGIETRRGGRWSAVQVQRALSHV
jgi:DNA invertase Pin-like site-specific DNA recombinase